MSVFGLKKESERAFWFFFVMSLIDFYSTAKYNYCIMKLKLEQIKSITLGAVNVFEKDGYFDFHRFTPEQEALYDDPKNPRPFSESNVKSLTSAGIKLRFVTNTKSITLTVRFKRGMNRCYYSTDVCCNGKFVGAIASHESIPENLKEDLEEKGIKLIINNNCEEEVLHIDSAKLKRVFSNIIANSARYTPKKGKITIKCKRIEQYVEFTISDNGQGVPEQNLNKIFEPLFTSDPSRKISGLGLYICKEIVETHGVYIYARNNNNGLDVILLSKRIKIFLLIFFNTFYINS